MVYINNWIISITTAVFFIIAVEMILPNNSIKKYVSFVLGLILIIIIMNPIIKLLNREFDFTKYLTDTMKYVENDNKNNTYDEYKIQNINKTLENFKLNIENVSVEKLNSLNPKNNYKVTAEVKYDMTQNLIKIGKVKVGVKAEYVKKIKKIKINNDSKNESDNEKILNNDLSESIKDCLSNELNISKDNIIVYEL